MTKRLYRVMTFLREGDSEIHSKELCDNREILEELEESLRSIFDKFYFYHRKAIRANPKITRLETRVLVEK